MPKLAQEQPWVWSAERAAYWREPEVDWVVTWRLSELITPTDHPLATGTAAVAALIERASNAAAGALDALLPPPDPGNAHAGPR